MFCSNLRIYHRYYISITMMVNKCIRMRLSKSASPVFIRMYWWSSENPIIIHEVWLNKSNHPHVLPHFFCRYVMLGIVLVHQSHIVVVVVVIGIVERIHSCFQAERHGFGLYSIKYTLVKASIYPCTFSVGTCGMHHIYEVCVSLSRRGSLLLWLVSVNLGTLLHFFF